MNKSIAILVPLLVRGLTPSVITFGLLPAPTYSAPGDLDPSFGNFGRVGPLVDLTGPVWSLEALSSGALLIAGGYAPCDQPSYCEYYNLPFTASNFLSELSDSGIPDAAFSAGPIANAEIFDVAPLADGGVLAVGLSVVEKHPKMAVFRLTHDGALDKSFGKDGSFVATSTPWTDHRATSVVLEPDGSLVVAGSRDTALGSDAAIVFRLQPNGALDESFGEGGYFTIASAASVRAITHILRTSGGGYRISTPDCRIIGLTAAGQLDTAFGQAGIAGPLAPSGGVTTGCEALAGQADGRLLVAGYDDTFHGFVARLLANGATDASFAPGAVAAGLSKATALAVGGDDSIVVAGARPDGLSGVVVMRLQANGLLDSAFGKVGHTIVDLPSVWGTQPVIHDLYLRPDGSVVAAGGDSYYNNPFVVRLLGSTGAAQPGVLGTSAANLTVTEQDGEAIVKVQRTGGSAGAVSLAYQAQSLSTDSSPAIAGQDYTAVSGRLTWADGDTSEREIHVPIASDNISEPDEDFYVKLSDPQGGAGLATQNAAITIAGDSLPTSPGGKGNSGDSRGAGAMGPESLLILAGGLGLGFLWRAFGLFKTAVCRTRQVRTKR